MIAAGLWGGALASAHWSGGIAVLDRIEAPLTDLRFLLQGPRPPPTSVVIVAIDDRTAQEVGAYPLPRTVIADILTELTRKNPKAIALDLLLVDRSLKESDEKLAAALRKIPSILAAAALFDTKAQPTFTEAGNDLLNLPRAQNLFLPLRLFADAAAVGSVNIATDRSGVPRHIPLLLNLNDQLVPSFPLRTISVVKERNPVLGDNMIEIGDTRIRTDIGYMLPLRFYGPAGTIQTVSASDVLNNRVKDDVVRDRIVVIGSTVTGGGDVFPTPFDQVLPGAEVLATAISNLAQGDALIRDRRVRIIDAMTATILPILLVLLLAWHRSTWGFAIIGTVALLWIAITVVAFTQGIWLSATLPLAAAAPPAILFGAMRLWSDRRRADDLAREGDTLKRFQPPSLAERLARDPDFLADPVHQRTAMVFIDLSGFTGLSETLNLDDMQEMLRGFHTLVDAETVRHHGLVASFMGDGAMALFGLPEPAPDDAANAVAACIGLCARMEPWLASLPGSVSSRLGFKVGAHCGDIIASRLGGDSHQHITVVGDAVNVASRLMEIAAFHHAEVALSDELLRNAGSVATLRGEGILEGPFPTAIRGRSGSIPIWLWRKSPAQASPLSDDQAPDNDQRRTV
ncbi:CHASE2 domain-containing protein [Microvirga rosea]|uniref:CHASE2 domain-containing protein n=1 Tax=Microvirga rosea TaxID=2715425 RepID=UPI001D0B7A51|nr:adenylate/guanylate cyclase domain-containing protein [Microvirga rosea]MCB8822535.1 adenylate/guanylate cyclase domain-containing protein [Microvirga rosea]